MFSSGEMDSRGGNWKVVEHVSFLAGEDGKGYFVNLKGLSI